MTLGWGQRSNIKFRLPYQFQRFLYQTLCVFSPMIDTKHIRQDFYSVAWVMPPGVWGCPGGLNIFFQTWSCDISNRRGWWAEQNARKIFILGSNSGDLEVTGLLITWFLGGNSAPFPMPKSMFFPKVRQKNPNLTEFFFFWSSFFISYNTIVLCRRDTKESTCLLWDITTEKSGLCCYAVRITHNTYVKK